MTAGWIAIAVALAVAMGFFNTKKKPEDPADANDTKKAQGGESPNG